MTVERLLDGDMPGASESIEHAWEQAPDRIKVIGVGGVLSLDLRPRQTPSGPDSAL